NDLNVFPIPDGDTGDNMYMTIDSGATEIYAVSFSDIGSAAERAAKGMLLGARGNSGVILSRIFAGIAYGLKDLDKADIAAFSAALGRGVEESYNAVSQPVEGTILTVFKDAVRFAGERITSETTVLGYFNDLIEEMQRSIDRTPELLAVLKESGVVDSGGVGLFYIAEGMKDALSGNAETNDAQAVQKAKAADVSLFTEESVLEFGYCTEFLLRLQRAKTDIESFDLAALIDYLNANGDSVVAFKDGSIVKVHVHTFRPGEILNHCQQYGEFLTLKIENMTLQHSGHKTENSFSAQTKPHKKYGIVSVAAGKGIKDIFYSLGCDFVVDGGQSMNPSAEDFINAFRSINADNILVFPNNGNVLLTARQASELYDGANIYVIPSKTIAEGYAAISMLDTSSDDIDEITGSLCEVISGVVTGFVSTASRDTQKDGMDIVKGDYIGFSDDVIYSDSKDKNTAAEMLTDKLGSEKYDVMLLLCGESATEEESDALYKKLKDKYKRTEIIMLDGGQPIYDYIIVLE
ncbi:MAG: DAK2 domain-containing protein, partial [Clostridia bacterium]|nr:DAK2 domain-containing protein [Clostridia bacterium]